MDLENNGASLPSSDASIADRVAPEPLDSAGDVLAVEDISFVLEEPAFQVHFQNDNGQTQVTVEGDDQDQFLFDLTHAFKETVVRFSPTFTSILSSVCHSQKSAYISVSQFNFGNCIVYLSYLLFALVSGGSSRRP